MVKCYLAAPYGARAQARRYCDDLIRWGHQPTSEWAYGTRPLTEATVHTAPALSNETVGQYSAGDLSNVAEAKILIVLTEAASEIEAGGAGSGGRHIETGYALGLGKHVIVVGEPDNIFHRSRLVTRVDSWEQVEAKLAVLSVDVAYQATQRY